MPTAPRLKERSLEELGLVDAPDEPAFDNLTRLASALLGTQVSLLSILQFDRDRQVLKSRFGVPEPHARFAPVLASRSICRYVVRGDRTLVVPDAPKDPVIGREGAVAEFGIGAYLGTPVRAPDGSPLGALCVIDGAPHAWSPDDIAHLEALAACASDVVRMKSMVIDVDELRREQQEFTYAVSHDMKSPIVTLRMLLEEIRDEEGDRLSDDSRELMALAGGTMDRAERLIEDVLDYSTSVHGVEAPTSVSLDELFGTLRDDLRGDLVRSEAVLEVGALPIVEGSPLQLGMLFKNLVGNALKFVEPGVPPRIEVRAESRERHALIRVVDHGIGIPARHHERVFSLFQRLHGPEAYPGSGLGLSLCRRIARNHGGRIGIESSPGKGSTFTVRLPLPRSVR